MSLKAVRESRAVGGGGTHAGHLPASLRGRPPTATEHGGPAYARPPHPWWTNEPVGAGVIDSTDLERLRAAGFTEQQVSAIADVIQHATRDLVTREYLDLRLRTELELQKWSILRWTLVMQVVVAASLYVALRYSA